MLSLSLFLLPRSARIRRKIDVPHFSARYQRRGTRRVSRERNVISGTRCLSFPPSPFHLLAIFSRGIDDHRYKDSSSSGSSETGHDRRRRADRSGKGYSKSRLSEDDAEGRRNDAEGLSSPRTPPYHLCSQTIMCARVWNDVGASLSFWNRARFFRLFSPSSPSARSLRPCGLGRLRVCYLAATPLSNLQHRDARMQHTRLPCDRYALNSTQLRGSSARGETSERHS